MSDGDSVSSSDDAIGDVTVRDNLPQPNADAQAEINDDIDESGNDSEYSYSSADSDAATLDGMGRNQNPKKKRPRYKYNDQYLELFKQTFDAGRQDDEDAREEEFVDSQLGAVMWTAAEKARFFTSLTKYGRHDLPRLSAAINTKSQVEVKSYLDFLHQEFVDRQLFERETKNVSHAEIEAAIEVGSDLEDELEQAADALQAMQDDYDAAAGQQKTNGPWLVDRAVAQKFEAEKDHDYDANMASGSSKAGVDIDAERAYRNHLLFRLVNWLDLSERVFMNRSPHDTYDHWSAVTSDGQAPAMTVDAIRDFRNLTVSLTQRISQVAIFIAKSRIRSNMDNSNLKAKIVTKADVHTALDVLNMNHDAWDFWTNLPRRNRLKIYTDSRRRGRRHRNFISWSTAEKFLVTMSARRSSRSRSQSRSGAASPLSEPEASTSTTSDDSGSDEMDTGSESSASPGENFSLDNGLSVAQEATGANIEGMEISTDSDVIDDRPVSLRVSREKRRQLLEDAHDDYMERMDQKKRRKHEVEIRRILGQAVVADIKQEEDDIGMRPRTLRKTQEELRGWSCLYEAEWEQHLKNRTPSIGEDEQEVSGLEKQDNQV